MIPFVGDILAKAVFVIFTVCVSYGFVMSYLNARTARRDRQALRSGSRHFDRRAIHFLAASIADQHGRRSHKAHLREFLREHRG